MPITVTKEVTTDDLMPGDLVVNAKSKTVIGHTVNAKRLNRTRYVVAFAPDIEKPFSQDAAFTVQREELTDEEVAESNYRRDVESLRRTIESIASVRHAEVVKQFVEQGTSAYLRWSEFSDLMEGQERASLQAWITDQADLFQRHGVDELTALKGAFGSVVAMAKNRYPQDPLSRSTSVMSNLMDDMRNYIQDRVIKHVTEWSYSREELLAVHSECNKAVRAQNEIA